MYCRSRKAQSTLEYVILIGFVVAALIAMGIYMKRGFQGKLRESTNQIGEQYEAGKTTNKYTTKSFSDQRELLKRGGETVTWTTNTEDKIGSEKVSAEQVP